MTGLLELTGPDHKEMIKEAILGKALLGIGSLMGRAGKVIVKNPLKSTGKAINTGFNVSSGMGTARNISDQAALGQGLGTSQTSSFGRTM